MLGGLEEEQVAREGRGMRGGKAAEEEGGAGTLVVLRGNRRAVQALRPVLTSIPEGVLWLPCGETY